MAEKRTTKAEEKRARNAKRPQTPGRVLPGAILKNPPPRNAAEVIRDAARSGASRHGVAVALGISNDLLKRWLAEFPELDEAFQQGRELERKTLHSKLHDMAMNGNVAAAIFLLKARHEGYVESGPTPDNASRVNIVLNIPGAMPLTTFIEHGTTPAQQLPDNTADSSRGG